MQQNQQINRLLRLIWQMKDKELLEALWETFPQYRIDLEYVEAINIRRIELNHG